MKFSATAALLGVTAPLAAAFPAAMMEAIQNEPKLLARVEEMMDKRQAGAGAATAIFEPVPTFSEKQRIDLSNYPWKAPGKNDLRGPCPGLNAFANHGLLPRNGYATVQQYIDVTEKVVGMGPVLSTFLSVLGGAIDSGELTAWSMGGTPPPGVGGLLAGNGKGLSGSHNKYESDASPTRPDLYDPSSGANDYKTVASQFQELIDYCPGSVTMECLTSFRSHRFDTQIARNPYFFNGPFTGVLVQPAAYTFIYRFMANHTAANPTGELSYDVIKSWFGIQGNDGSYVAKQGWERIPDNWYRRAFEYPYEVSYFLADVVNAAALHPKFLNVGGNTGTVNSFAGVDISDLTGGVFNSAALTDPNKLGCFAFQAATQVNSDFLTGLTQPLANVLSGLACPKLKAIDDAQLRKFPGYKRST